MVDDWIEKTAAKLRSEMLEAEISNVLPGTDDGQEIIRNRHMWLIIRTLEAVAERGASEEYAKWKKACAMNGQCKLASIIAYADVKQD